MTDTPSSTDPADDDLLASLYLDGEATAEERARVEADPALMARVRSFEAVANDLNSVTPPPDLARLQISAALDLFDQQQTPVVEAVATAPVVTGGVTSLSERRERKQSRGIPNWLSAAAALALVVGGLGFASTLGDDNDESTAASADDSAEALASGANRSFEEDAAAPEAATAEVEQETDLMADAAEESAETVVADDAAMQDEAMQDEVMEEEAMEDDAADSSDDDAEAAETVSPVPLDGFQAATAAEYLELLSDQPLRPIDDSPCAGSPLVEGLFGVDSFIEVVFEGEISSLLVQEGVPSTAVIVGPTCEIELE